MAQQACIISKGAYLSTVKAVTLNLACLSRAARDGTPGTGDAAALTFRPASLLCRFMSVRAFCLISRASTNTLAKPIPYRMSAEQPPHFQPSSLWYCPCFSLSQPQSLRLPCVQAAVIACATPAAMMAYVNAASRLPGTNTWYDAMTLVRKRQASSCSANIEAIIRSAVNLQA